MCSQNNITDYYTIPPSPTYSNYLYSRYFYRSYEPIRDFLDNLFLCTISTKKCVLVFSRDTNQYNYKCPIGI